MLKLVLFCSAVVLATAFTTTERTDETTFHEGPPEPEFTTRDKSFDTTMSDGLEHDYGTTPKTVEASTAVVEEEEVGVDCRRTFYEGIKKDLKNFDKVVKEEDTVLMQRKHSTERKMEQIKNMNREMQLEKMKYHLHTSEKLMSEELDRMDRERNGHSNDKMERLRAGLHTTRKWIYCMESYQQDTRKCEKDHIKAIEDDIRAFRRVVKPEDGVLMERKQGMEKMLKDVKEKKKSGEMSEEEARKEIVGYLRKSLSMYQMSKKDMDKYEAQNQKELDKKKRYEAAIKATEHHVRCMDPHV